MLIKDFRFGCGKSDKNCASGKITDGHGLEEYCFVSNVDSRKKRQNFKAGKLMIFSPSAVRRKFIFVIAF